MSVSEAALDPPAAGIVDFVRRHKREILDDWHCLVKGLPSARRLDRPTLLDHLPDVLDRVACMAEALLEGRVPDDPEVEARQHALHRLDVGFDLHEVVTEFAHLRACILRRWEAEDSPDGRRGIAAFNEAVDRAVAASVQRYTAARDRTLRAIDRISAAALESQDLDEMLHKLLGVLVGMTEAVDTAVLLLREGDVLRSRAAVGLEEEVTAGFTVRVGEGFAGTIAAEGRPRFVRAASTDALVMDDHVRAKGVRALYGVPLVAGGEVVGVVHVGSLTADDLSDQDQQLVRATAHRAAMAVTLHVLRQREKEAVEALDAERRWWKAAMERIPVGVVVGEAPSGRALFANARAEELAGPSHGRMCEPEERDVPEVRDLSGDRVPAERFPLCRAARGETVVGEELVLPSRRPPVTLRVHAAPIRDPDGRILGAVVAFDDVTEHKRIEAEQRFLKDATAVLAATLDGRETLSRLAKLAVPRIADWCAIDLRADHHPERLVIEHADPAKVAFAHELRRRYPLDAEGPRCLSEVLRTGVPELYEDLSDEVLGEFARDAEHLDALRSLGLRSAMLVPIAAQGALVGAITLVSAESGRRYTARDLEVARELAARAALALENARLYREAQEAFHARQQVLAIVSHDLRNPLGAMKMGLALLDKSLADRLQREVLERMGRSVDRMHHLVRDLLDLASIEAGKLSISLASHACGELLAEAIEAEEPLAREKGVTLERGADVAVALRCDRNRVLQVLGNLIGNAVKFARRGDRIRVSARALGSEVELEVCDTGPGIAAADLPHLFAPYWSGAGQHGTGLGLFISKAIVEAHGGRIRAESGSGTGTRLVFTLPVAAA